MKPSGKPGVKAAAKPGTTQGGAPKKPNRLRIIGGAWRGRTFEAPLDEAIRPTTDRVRENLFNRLMHGAAGSNVRIQGARVVDLFAGTGAMGLEALSRGASHVTFVERDPTALALLRRNIAALGAEDRTSVISADATALPRAAQAHTIAFLDPPYGENLAASALTALHRQGWMAEGALISLETDAGEPTPTAEGYALLDRRAYGRIAITLLLHS